MSHLVFKYMPLTFDSWYLYDLEKVIFPLVFSNINYLTKLKIKQVNIGDRIYDWAHTGSMCNKDIIALTYNITQCYPFGVLILSYVRSPKGLDISVVASRVAGTVPDTEQVVRKSSLINQLCKYF